MDNIGNIVSTHYGIEIINKWSQQGGWASLAYKVYDGKKFYFLKVYEKQRASTPKLTALIDQYVPILMWLEKNSNLKNNIASPFLTIDGDYKCEDENNIYLLYDYIEGETIGNQELTDNQIEEFSQIISELHLYGEDLPFETEAIKEDFDVSFLEQLWEILNSDHLPFDLGQQMRTYGNPLKEMIANVRKLSKCLKAADLKKTLCHTDLHYWNLMQSKHLMLIDWEGLKLAPVEADIMFLIEKPYFDKFLRIYHKKHPNFSLDHNALQFYQERRKLEDIWEFIEQLLYDKQTEQERAVTMNFLKSELKSMSE